MKPKTRKRYNHRHNICGTGCGLHSAGISAKAENYQWDNPHRLYEVLAEE